MASAVVGALRVDLGINSAEFYEGLRKAQGSLKDFGNSMRTVGRNMSTYLTAPIVGFGALTIKTAGDFEASMNRVDAASGATAEEFKALQEVADWGWVDCFRKFEAGGGHYTYWDFVIPNSAQRGLGWRIDHIYASPSYAEKCTSCIIDKAPRMLEIPSDHTFVIAEFN